MTAPGPSPRSRSARLRAAAALLGAGALVLALGSSGGCGSDTPPPPPDAGPDAGPDGGQAATWSAPATVDSAAGSGLDLIAAVDPQGRPAVAYFTFSAVAGQDGGLYPLTLARELTPGTWTTETVPAAIDGGALTGHFGVALAFDASGNPLLAYVGGHGTLGDAPPDGRWNDLGTGLQLPSDAVLARKSGAAWTRYSLGTMSNSFVADGLAVDDQGGVIGLWPAIAVDPSGAIHVVQRDVHFGVDQSATDSSNLEYAQFTLGASAATQSAGTGDMVGSFRTGEPCVYDPADAGTCAPVGKRLVSGAGNYNRMVLAGGQPAVTFALAPDSTAEARQVWFAKRTAPAAADNAARWTKARISAAQGQAGHPPSLAYSASAGAGGAPLFAVAFYDLGGGSDLRLATSSDGAVWSDQPIEAAGVTGLHPAAAFGGAGGGTLGLLYAFCRSAIDPNTSCNQTTQELRFRAGPPDAATLFFADVERIAGVMPDQTALVADGQGKFVAIWREPGGVVKASRRSP